MRPTRISAAQSGPGSESELSSAGADSPANYHRRPISLRMVHNFPKLIKVTHSSPSFAPSPSRLFFSRKAVQDSGEKAGESISHWMGRMVFWRAGQGQPRQSAAPVRGQAGVASPTGLGDPDPFHQPRVGARKTGRHPSARRLLRGGIPARSPADCKSRPRDLPGGPRLPAARTIGRQRQMDKSVAASATSESAPSPGEPRGSRPPVQSNAGS